MFADLCDIHTQFLNLKSLLNILDHLLGTVLSFDALELNSIIRHCHVEKPTSI